MIIDLNSLMDNEKVKYFDDSVLLESIDFQGMQYEFLEPVSVKGKLAKVGSIFELSADVSGQIYTNCARCGNKIAKDISCEVFEELEKADFVNNKIDISDCILQTIITNLPVRFLCKDDCKGLCPVCGKDLNFGDCGCEKETGNNQFAILKKLLGKDEV